MGHAVIFPVKEDEIYPHTQLFLCRRDHSGDFKEYTHATSPVICAVNGFIYPFRILIRNPSGIPVGGKNDPPFKFWLKGGNNVRQFESLSIVSLCGKFLALNFHSITPELFH